MAAKAKTRVNIQPLADRIVVRRVDDVETSRGGIIIPDTAKEKPQQAEVVAVGPGKKNEDGSRQEPEVSVGDRVLMGKYSAPTSRSTAKTTSFFAKTTCSRSSSNELSPNTTI